MKRIALLMGAILLLMVPLLTASPTRSLQVHTDTGTLAWCAPLGRSDTLQVQFTHSMFGGYVREQWYITPDDRFERTRFVTENAAAAEYYATDGTSYQADDGFVVPGDPLHQAELVVRVNSRGNHIISIGGNTVRLADRLEQSTQVRISVATESCPKSD